MAASRYRLSRELPPVPVLVLGSAKDRLVDPNCSIQLARQANLPLKMHPDAGHDLPLDDPQWVVKSIKEWLKELESR